MKYFIISFTSLLISTGLFAQSPTEKIERANATVSVTDMEDVPIPNAKIFFIDTKAEKTLEGVSGENGRFQIELAPGLYNIRLKHDGKTRDYTFIEIPKLKENEQYGNVQIIVQYEEQSSFVLSNLHFETNKAVIRDESFEELNELVNYLKENKDVRIEIAGHTDSDGSEEDNLDLSQRRAESVQNYLEQKGISKDRLIAKGYGEEQPISDNSNKMGKAMNRRTEIHFLDEAGRRLVEGR